MNTLKITASAIAAVAAMASAASARDNIQIAGSSTVLPYATIVAQAFAENFADFKAPVVEGGGSGAGLKQFCEGVGDNTIDIANASRAIKAEELKTCAENGVKNVMEVRIGYDGIVFASDKNGPDFKLEPKDVFLALAKDVVVDGKIVPNTAANWSDVNPELPAQPIMAFIPGTKHGTREVFEEKVMHAGCKAVGAEEVFKAADAEKGGKMCGVIRTDGKSVDIDGDYTETLSRIASNKDGMGVFGLSFYENNMDKLKVATMGGITPSVETIADGSYPVSRPLFFYVKKDHIGKIAGLKEFAQFFMSNEMAGPGGPLANYGLVSDPKLADTQAAIEAETVMAAQ